MKLTTVLVSGIIFAAVGNTQTTLPPNSTCFEQCYQDAEGATTCSNNGESDFDDFDHTCLCSDKVWLGVFGACILNSQAPCPKGSDTNEALYYVEQICAQVGEPIEVATATSPSLKASGFVLTPAATDTSESSCLAACFSSSFPTGSCHSTDTSCLCNNMDFAETVENCILTAAPCAGVIDASLQAVKQACSAAGANISFTSTTAVSTTSSTSSSPPPPLPASPVPTPKPTNPGAPSPLTISFPSNSLLPSGASGSNGGLTSFPAMGAGMIVMTILVTVAHMLF